MLLQQLRWLRSVVPILLLLLTEVYSYPTAPTRLRCYVCGGENAESCGDLTSKPPATSLQLCPESAQGCLTQAEDKTVTRSCVDLKITDCKAANGKVYCYCDTDACNDKPASIGHSEDEEDDDLIHRHQLENATNEWQRDLDSLEKRRQKTCEEDDEDLCAGSGNQPEDRLEGHLTDAIANAGASRPTTTSSSTTEKATTQEDKTSISIEETTRSSVDTSDKTLILKEAGTTPTSKLEPSRGCAFKSFLPLSIIALVSVLYGNVWLSRN